MIVALSDRTICLESWSMRIRDLFQVGGVKMSVFLGLLLPSKTKSICWQLLLVKNQPYLQIVFLFTPSVFLARNKKVRNDKAV